MTLDASSSSLVLILIVIAAIIEHHVNGARSLTHTQHTYYHTSRERRTAIIAEAEERHEGYASRSAFRRACSKPVIYARDNGVCGICGRGVRWNDAQLDHIYPLARGGEHSPRNLQISHQWCNLSKGSKR